jgi:hypothetical protein
MLALLTVVSSVSLYVLAHTKQLLALCGAILVSGFFWGYIIYGLTKARCATRIGLLIFFAGISLVPTYLFNHVSELYVYQALPPLALVVGIGFGHMIREQKSKSRHVWGWCIVLAFLGFHIFAVQCKAAMMVHNGERTRGLLDQIIKYVEEAPENTTIVLRNDENDYLRYSVFMMPGYEVLRYSRNLILAITGRDDVSGQFLEAGETIPDSVKGPIISLRLCEEGMSLCRE